VAVAGVENRHQPAVAQAADVGKSLVRAGPCVFADEDVQRRRDDELALGLLRFATDHDVLYVRDALVGVEADSAAGERRVLGFIEHLAVERHAQRIADALQSPLVPLARWLVQTADPLDLVPRLVHVGTHQDGLRSVEVDVVVRHRIAGADDESAGQHARLGRLDQELGLQGDIGELPRREEGPAHLLAAVQHQLAAADRARLGREDPLARGLRRGEIDLHRVRFGCPLAARRERNEHRANNGNQSETANSMDGHGRSPPVSCEVCERIVKCCGDPQPLRALPVLGADATRFTAPRTQTCVIRQVRQRPQ